MSCVSVMPWIPHDAHTSSSYRRSLYASRLERLLFCSKKRSRKLLCMAALLAAVIFKFFVHSSLVCCIIRIPMSFDEPFSLPTIFIYSLENCSYNCSPTKCPLTNAKCINHVQRNPADYETVVRDFKT